MVRFCGLFIAALLFAVPFGARADCAALGDAVPKVAAARAALLALPTPEDLDTDIAAATQRGIAYLKDTLGELVAARMQCAAADEKPETIAADLMAALRPLGAGCDAQCAINPYHDLPEFGVERTDDARHLLAIVARQRIQCGHDTLLWVYEADAGGWRERLRWQAPPYDKVSGALEAFDYRISPPDASGAWYVLVKDIMPWCSSTWSTIRYAALRPGATPSTPRIVFHAHDSMWWGNDDIGTLAAAAGDFEVRFHAASIEPAVHNRVYIRHFAIDGGQVRRVPPVALTPRDFVDEWIVSKWTDAAQWSAPEQRAPLAAWHVRLHGNGAPYYEFFAARKCAATQHVEVELLAPEDQRSYFLQVDTSADLRMLRVANTADPHCAGEDLLGAMLTE